MADDLDFGATIKGFAPGQRVFNRYKLERILGRGGMGVVWLARDEELEREVALKFLPEVVVLDKEAVRDLKRETRRSLELTHSHIVRIYDFIQDAHTAAISMEYIAGETVAARKVDHPAGRFEAAELQLWVRQLCEALGYAHTKGEVVHRDLKPVNLMIDARGDLKIADFGIAASVSDSVSRVSAQAGSSGTPVYMSPQQMMGEKPAVTDDIYAAGATIYELLTGKPPFYSGNVLMQVQSKLPPTIAARRKELGTEGAAVPAEWEQAIAACLAKEAKDRPQSAGEVAERLGLTTNGPKPRPEDSRKGRASRPDEPQVERLDASAEASREGRNPKTLSQTKGNALGAARSTSKTPLYAALTAGVLLFGGLGWYFSSYAPEQKRLAEIARLETENKAEEANRLRTEREKAAAEARARQDREAVVAKVQAEHLAAARGGILVRTNPAGAEVRVGAIALDKSPLTLKEQKLGKYPVRVRLDGYEEWTGEVEVKENEFAELNIELARWSGRLALSAEAEGVEAEVRARDGSGPAQQVRPPATLTLPVGRYELVFHRRGWPDQTKSVEVARNQQSVAAVDYRGVRRSPEWYGTAGVAELQAAAAAGDLEARVRLGDHYYLGLDGAVDVKRAFDQYQQAVGAKYLPAYRRLGLLLAGYLVGPDPALRQVDLLREGARLGDPMSMLAWQLRTKTPSGLKDSTPVIAEADLAPALQKVEAMAQQGDIFAMEQLGSCYSSGTGAEKNAAKARQWWKEGADRGSVRCMNLYAGTLLTDKNVNEALDWLNKAAAHNGDQAINRMALMYMYGNQVTADKTKALSLHQQAAAHGYYSAMGALAAAYESGDGVTADPAESFRWRQKAAESGSPFYLSALALAYKKGVGPPANPAKSAELYRRAAEWNDLTGLHQLGLLYAAGSGVGQDEARAIEYFRRAARLNYSPSQEELKKRNLTW